MGQNRVFFPQDCLDRWIGEARVDLIGPELHLKASSRRYRVVEAVHIVAEVTGVPDTYELVGRVKSHVFLAELGAEVLDTSVVLGDNAYEVVPGFLGIPVETALEHAANRVRQEREGREGPVDEEAILRRCLLDEST
jgi:hypothetical protein